MLRAKDRNDEGTSLAEVLVAMGLTVGVLLAILSVTTSTNRAARQSEARGDDVNAVRLASYTVSRALRAASAPSNLTQRFVAGDDNTVTFYSALDNADAAGVAGGPSKRTYAVEVVGAERQFVERVREADPGSATVGYTYTGPERVRVLARNLVTTQPVFRFLNVSGAELGVAAPPLKRSLQPEDLKEIKTVELRLESLTRTNPSVQPTVVVNRIRISNAYYKSTGAS